MSCLLPQFKCLPDTFPLSFKTHQQSSPQLLKGRDPIQLRTLCVLSTTSPTTSTAATTVLDIEKLQLPSIEVLSNSVAGDRWKPPSITATSTVAPESPWIYDGGVGLSTEANTKAALATENLLASEAVIADAAAEAIALAKAALKVARDAVTLVGHDTSKKSDNALTGTLSTAGTTLPERARQVQPGKLGQVSTVGEQRESDVRWSESELSGNLLTDSEDLEPTQEELELLQSQLLNGIAVRSKRQNERKAKRERAAERAASTVVSVKSGSSGRKKKRSSLKDVDYADPLHYLRGTTSNFRLLSASEEQKLSEGIQDLIKLERLQEELAERCGGEPSFSQWASAAGVDQKTLRKRLDHGLLCKDKMIKSNIRLVISIAKTYKGTGMSLQDLVQEGCRGLVKGAEKFDAEKGFKFSTYAHWWIKQAVRKSLSEQSRTIRLPFHIVEASFRVKEARKRLYTENGKDPDDEEIAEATGLTMKRLEAVYLAPTTPISLDQKTGINEDLSPYDVISDPLADTPETTMTKQFMRRDLQKALDSLNSRERQVIHWRFGMDNGRMKTLQEIGELMGVTRERIRQIESSAFRKLKSKKRTKLLQQYAAVCRVQN